MPDNDEDKKGYSKSASNQLSSDTENQDDSQDSSESIKPNAIYEIVQAVRKETQLSHEMSKVAVETVLISLRVCSHDNTKNILKYSSVII